MTSRCRRATALAPLALLPGCYLVDYPSIDDACPGRVPGQQHLEDGVQDVLLRINCHRRFVNLAQIPVTRFTQDAVLSHATYLDQNGILEPSSPNYAETFADLFEERQEFTFFSGRTAYDRLTAAQAVDTTQSYRVWEALLPQVDYFNADREFDFWGFRDVAFQPLIVSGGYAEVDTTAGLWAYMNLVYTLPAARRVDDPVIYPKDGQVDVPTSFASPFPIDDPLAVRSATGYPITITVGSWEEGGGTNPYKLRVITASLTSEDGEELEIVAALPGNYPWGPNTSTVAFAAVAPLKPGTTYTLEADLAWNVKPRKHVRTTFTTYDGTRGDEPADTDP